MVRWPRVWDRYTFVWWPHVDGVVVRMNELKDREVPVGTNLRDLAQLCLDDSKRWFPETAHDILHHTLGLAGEAGEVANELKKIQRGDHPLCSLDNIDDWPSDVKIRVGSEVVDVLVYAMNLFATLGVNPDAIFATVRANNERRFRRDPGF